MWHEFKKKGQNVAGNEKKLAFSGKSGPVLHCKRDIVRDVRENAVNMIQKTTVPCPYL